jgi:hypothetical protein
MKRKSRTEYKAVWRKENPDKAKGYSKSYRSKYPEKSREAAKDRARRNRKVLKEIVMAVYSGGQCSCCGETEISFLTIDHVDGGGQKHRKEVGKAGSPFYKWLLSNGFPGGFQVLCANCNQSKAINGGICAHQIQD